MAHSTSAAMLDLSAGALIGFGLSGTYVSDRARGLRQVIAGSNGARPPSVLERRRALSVSSSFRRSPFSLMDVFGWQNALVTFAIVILVVLPASLALATPPSSARDLARPLRSRCDRRSAKRLGIAPMCC